MTPQSPIARRRVLARPRQAADEALSCVLVFSGLGLLLHCLAALAWNGDLAAMR